MGFYLVFPLLYIAASKLFRFLSGKWYLLLLVYVILMVLLIVIVFEVHSYFGFAFIINRFLYYNLLNQLPVFITGIFLYFFLKMFNININRYVLLVLLVATIVLAFLYFNNLGNITIIPLLSGISFCFLLLVFKDIKLLNNRILRRIGQLSFSIYIFHFLFTDTITKGLSRFVFKGRYGDVTLITSYLIVVFASYSVALLSEKYIENKGIEMGKRPIIRLKDKSLSNKGMFFN
jgi:peptidoglycan/LPS O-acetylase OafA/YrhL